MAAILLSNTIIQFKLDCDMRVPFNCSSASLIIMDADIKNAN